MIAGQFSATGMESSEAKITTVLIISCIIAATGGLMFGYDIAVTGGVTSMESFLNKFFPVAYRKTMNQTNGNYCKDYLDKELNLFLSSLYVAGVAANLFASYTTRRFGRKLTLLIAGIFFIVGVILSSAAQDLAMLIIGRILFGCGVGFANQAVPIYLSEIAPTRKRGALNILFQLNVTIGILFANLVNYGTSKIRAGWGWRLSLGFPGIPAAILTIGAFFIVETPNSLIERGHLEKGKEVLRKIRGTDHNIEPEFLELVEASRIAKQVKQPYRNLLLRRNRPQLVVSLAFQTSQQFTGINTITFYVPVFLKTIGYGRDLYLYSFVITGVVNVISTVISMLFVDKIGRRKLLLEAGLHMFLSHFLIAIIVGIKVKDHSADLSPGLATFVIILICTFLSSYAWSWGALGWLIPSETFPLETRSAGQSVTICVNFLCMFVTTQTFFPMLCSLKFGIFLFFSGWIIVMYFFVFFLVPETKNIPIEDIRDRVWKQHWLWKRFLDHDYGDDQEIRNR